MLKGVKIVRERNKSYNKYGNKKVIVDGYKFDSQKEALRYKELKLMEKAGVVKDLELQPAFELIPTIRTEHETLRKTVYKADFRYFDVKADHEVVEDVKGFKTDVYKLKKKMLLYKYKDIDFREV